MGADLTPEKIEKMKLNHDKKISKNIYEKNSNPQYKNNLNVAFKNLYKPQKYNKLNDENETTNIFNDNNIYFSVNTIRSEEKLNVNNNLKPLDLDDTKEINNIIFRNHKSFEPTISIPTLNLLKKDDTYNDKKIENDIVSTITTTVNTIKLGEANSAQDSMSENSDYIDITRSAFFTKINKKIAFDKLFYTNANNIRDAYYNKLIINGIWKPYKDKISNTLFFFDWDDTLMCTSAIVPIINSNKTKINNNKIREKLKTLDEISSNLLKRALGRGIVFIITNASPGWVEYSSANFLPLTYVVLNKVKIISTKALFSKNYPGDTTQWKIKAYKYAIEQNNINTKIISNIICFGDSIYDLEAIESLRYIFNNGYIKIIKFKENPHLVELEKQLWIVISQLDFIIKKLRNLTLKISKKKID